MKSAYQFFVLDKGIEQPFSSIEVRHDGDLVPIYSDKDGAPKANPFQTGDDGYALFYADAGTYNIKASYSGKSFEFVDVQIGTQTSNNVVQRYYLTSDTSTVSKSGAIFGASVYVDGDYLPPDNGDGVVNWSITSNELGTITFTPPITASVGTPKTITVYWYSETNDAVLDLQGGLITYYQGQFDAAVAGWDADADASLTARESIWDNSLAQKESEFDIAISGIDGVDIGLYSTNPTYTAYNQYTTYDRAGTIERWYLKQSVPLGYIVDSVAYPDPQSDSANLYPSDQVTEQYVNDRASLANLLSNHNFLIQTPDDSQPQPDATPRSYPPSFEIFSGVFANETTGITNLTYIDGRLSFSGGDFYFPVPNSGGLERLTNFVASVADFDGKPRTRGVSYALVGDEYRITVTTDALEDVSANPTPLGSVKFEQGSVATGHGIQRPSPFKVFSSLFTDGTYTELNVHSTSVGDRIAVDDYAPGNNSGVLFFNVVADGTGTADGGKFVQGSGFQLEQIMKVAPTAKDWGAKGNGVDYDDAPFAAGKNYLRSGQETKELVIPASKYKFQSQFEYDISQLRVNGQSAILDFSDVTSGAAVRITGGSRTISGAPFLNGINPLSGVEIIGPGKASSGSQGVLFDDDDIQGSNDVTVKDVIIHDFETDLVLGDNAYHLTFESCSFFFSGTCVTAEQHSNAGARTVFDHCRFFNSDNGANLKNASSGSTSFIGCVIAGISTVDFLIEGGNLEVAYCDIETGGSQPSDHRVLWVNGTTSFSYISWDSNNVAVKNATTVPVFDIDSPCFLNMVGGEAFINASSTGGVFGSTGSGTGSINILGTFLDYGSNPLELFNGATINVHRFLPNLNTIVSNASYNTTGNMTAAEVKSSNGLFTNDDYTVQVTALSTWTSLGYAASQSGLLIIKDKTSGGMATYQCDVGTGICIEIANNITGLTSVGYPSGVLSVQLSSGTIPRNLSVCLVSV